MTQLLLRVLLICGMVGLIGCGSKLPALKTYKMEIQQGNVITSKMLMKLRPGMTKSQVRYILGTPLILDSFHPNRWDYFYELRKQGKVINKRRVILDFQENELVGVKGDVVPAEGDKVADEDANVLKTPKSVAPPKRVETSWWDGLKFWKKDEQAVAAPATEEEEGLFSGLRFWEKGEKSNQPSDLSQDDLAIIEAAEQGGKAAATTGAVVEKMAEKGTDAVKAAAVAATTAASAAQKSAEIVEADEGNYTFPENQPSATEAAIEEASAEVADAASDSAEATQSVLRQEIDVVPSAESAEATVVEAAKAVAPLEAVSAEQPVMDVAKDQADVADAVNAWAEAWRSKDLDAYVGNYVPTFKGKMRSRKSWLKQRDSRIAKRKGDISVDVEDIDVVMDGNKATAYFYQKYRSATYRDEVTKRVDFVRNKNTGDWLIWRETTIPKSQRPQVQEITAPENTDAYLDGAIEKIGF